MIKLLNISNGSVAHCHHCNSVMTYYGEDIQKDKVTDITGKISVSNYIVCPNCKSKIVVSKHTMKEDTEDIQKKKAELSERISQASAEYYKKSPCHNCGPGNGCDDCRGCEDGQLDHKLYKKVSELKEKFKKEFGEDVEQYRQRMSDFKRIDELEIEYNKIEDGCNKCGGNFNDDCRDCKTLDTRLDTYRKLKDLKTKYNRK